LNVLNLTAEQQTEYPESNCLHSGSVADFEWELPSPLDPPGVLAFRAAQVALRAGDVSFVLDALTSADTEPDNPLYGRVDCTRAAVAGHSFGGAAAAAAAQREPRLSAAVMLDAWQWPLGAHGVAAGLPCPSLLFESAAFLGDRDAFCAFNSRMSSGTPECLESKRWEDSER
jgi:pimeloyl-ACP methyl ester carboxylesterase